jgi:hypothetical protein
MMATLPQVTVTATMQDLLGALVPGSKLTMTLCGYGSQVPRIAGTSLLARVAPLPVLTPAGGFISQPIYGNYQITPAGTYYTFAVTDDSGNVVQLNAYQFLAAGIFDLSNTPLYIPAPGITYPLNPVYTNPTGNLQTIASSITINGNLIVTGTINGASSPVIVDPTTGIFDGSLGSGFKLTLSQLVNATFVNMAGKLLVTVRVVQPAAGPTWACNWPANLRNAGMVNPGNSSRSVQLFTVDTDGSLDGASGMMYS